MPRRDRSFRAGGTDGRARWGRAVSEGLILHAVPYGSLIIAVFYTAKAKKTQKNLRMCNFCCTFAAEMKAISLHSVVPVRAEAREGAEQETQMLFGELCAVLEEQPRWYRIRLDADGQV